MATLTNPPAGESYDLIIVGTGAAGMAAAIRASELGATAAIVEGGDVIGGTCVNVGCIPSKFLVEAAHRYHVSRNSFAGIAGCDPALAWDALVRSKRELVERLRSEKYTDVLAAYAGVTLLRGRATLTRAAPDGVTVRVDGQDIRARSCVLATGTRPALPPIPGLDSAGALDSTTVMELDRLPASLIVLGGGSIGLELGQALARFGVRVTVVEAADRLLPMEETDISRALAGALRAEGIEVYTGATVTSVERTDGGVRVELSSQGNGGSVLKGERILVATGRRPNTEGLGLESAGVHTDARGFIRVDAEMRTSASNVFAAGDVTGGPGFVYVAAAEGRIAADSALSAEPSADAPAPDLATVPRVTFTDPQVASVGLTEQEARTAGVMVDTTSMPVSSIARAAVSGRTDGLVKLVSEHGTGRLIGVHVLSVNAGDVIGEGVLAVRLGLGARDILATLHPYLTWGEALKLAAQTFTTDVAKLSCCA